MPIRDADRFGVSAGLDDCAANRGLAGIDGVLASALGFAERSRHGALLLIASDADRCLRVRPKVLQQRQPHRRLRSRHAQAAAAPGNSGSGGDSSAGTRGHAGGGAGSSNLGMGNSDWACAACTFVNKDAQRRSCAVCGTFR